MIESVIEVSEAKFDGFSGIPDTPTTKLPSCSTDDTTPAINQPEAALEVATSPLPGPKLTRQEKWRRKNKVRVAAYMKGWRAKRKSELLREAR